MASTSVVRIAALLALGVLVAAVGVAVPSAATEPLPGSPMGKEPPCSTTTGVSCVLGIPYVDDGLKAHTLDAYYPTDSTDHASVVLIHGGIWKVGSSRMVDPEAAYFAANGFAAFSINFTKSRRSTPSWPQVRTDIETATAWVMAHADEYHGDNSRVGVLGGSSGAHLAALLDTAGPENGVAPLAAVTWSGAMDLDITYRKGNATAKRGLRQLLGCTPAQCPSTYADASPVTHVSAGDGAMLLFHSSDERIPVAVAHEMNRALAAAAVPHTLVIFKGSSLHARQYECSFASVQGERLRVIDDSIRWLGARLGQPTQPTGTFCRPRLTTLPGGGELRS